MYSLNVPVPRRVARVAAGVASTCHSADVRTRHTLVVKRLGQRSPRSLARQVRRVLAGTAPFDVRLVGVDTFAEPASGAGPVVYLAVEGPALRELHQRLCEEFDPVAGLEAGAYVPHVTVARGRDASRAAEAEIDSFTWTVDRLALWDGTYQEPIEAFSLPP